MIFVTVGSQRFQFNRLLEMVDKWVQLNPGHVDVYAQTGYSTYEPKFFSGKSFLDGDEFSEKINEADLVITHGGSGAIVGSLKRGKKVIAVPRLAAFDEHVDNHQMEIIKTFAEGDMILSASNEEELFAAVRASSSFVPKPFKSNVAQYLSFVRKELAKME